MTEDEHEIYVRVALGTWPVGANPVQAAEEAVQHFPVSANLWMLRGDVISTVLSGYSPSLTRCGEGYSLADVLHSYRRATELDPNRVDGWETLGKFYDATGARVEAKRCFHEANRLKALRPKARFALSEVVRICGQPPDRALLIGELGTIQAMDYGSSLDLYPAHIPQAAGEYMYMVDIYRRSDCSLSKNLFWETHLEPTGHLDGLYSDEPPESAGHHGAALAISSSQLYLCACGGMMVETPELPNGREEIFKDLPRRTLAAGCTDPMLHRAVPYARAFNREVIKYVSAKYF